MRIALFFDGTWNAPLARTNVHALYRRTAARPGTQHVRYVDGVGVGRHVVGGALFGWGLDDRIVAGYTELVRNWTGEGDEIYLFGFSRGAFSARSLAGMIAKCGIVPPEVLPPAQVYDRYRDTYRPGLLEMLDEPRRAVTESDRRVLAGARLARIRFVGVFETVGGLGLPGPFAVLTDGRHSFHDTGLSGLVDIARHAVALDEPRSYFPSSLWTAIPKPVGGLPDVEQRWFVGGHSNIGGGPTVDLRRDRQLSTLPREWIAQEAAKAGLAITIPEPAPDAALGRIERADRSPVFGPLGRVPGLGFTRRHVRAGGVAETLDPSVGVRWEADPDYRTDDARRAGGLAEWLGQR
jgi:uncharacterized protein (DUF2235 family)